MAESSNPIPKSNMSFRLNSERVSKLKLALAALCDSDFNPRGLAMVDATDGSGFSIMVCNSETNAFADLNLDFREAINFHCKNPIVSKTINLNQFSEFLNLINLDEGGFVIFYHTDVTNHLYFNSENDPDNVWIIELWQNNTDFKKLPNVEGYDCFTLLQSTVLRDMIDRILFLNQSTQLVSANISQTKVTLTIHMDNPWVMFETTHEDKDFRALVLSAKNEDEYRAWVELHHLRSLKQASNVGDQFQLGFLSNELPGNIMIRFNFHGVGFLRFVQKAKLITKDPKLVSSVNPPDFA